MGVMFCDVARSYGGVGGSDAYAPSEMVMDDSFINHKNLVKEE